MESARVGLVLFGVARELWLYVMRVKVYQTGTFFLVSLWCLCVSGANYVISKVRPSTHCPYKLLDSHKCEYQLELLLQYFVHTTLNTYKDQNFILPSIPQYLIFVLNLL